MNKYFFLLICFVGSNLAAMEHNDSRVYRLCNWVLSAIQADIEKRITKITDLKSDDEHGSSGKQEEDDSSKAEIQSGQNRKVRRKREKKEKRLFALALNKKRYLLDEVKERMQREGRFFHEGEYKGRSVLFVYESKTNRRLISIVVI